MCALIPPGAADVAHYRVQIPEGRARGRSRFTAKLNYRKFSHYYTQFAYAGAAEARAGSGSCSISDYNSLEYSFDPSEHSGERLRQDQGRDPGSADHHARTAEATIDLPITARDRSGSRSSRKKDRERWNDWGIGLLLQGDLKGAEYAFTKVTEAEPGYADGWLNVARALIQEGETERRQAVHREGAANRLRSWAARIFFKALIQKADGDYDGALTSLRCGRPRSIRATAWC